MVIKEEEKVDHQSSLRLKEKGPKASSRIDGRAKVRRALQKGAATPSRMLRSTSTIASTRTRRRIRRKRRPRMIRQCGHRQSRRSRSRRHLRISPLPAGGDLEGRKVPGQRSRLGLRPSHDRGHRRSIVLKFRRTALVVPRRREGAALKPP